MVSLIITHFKVGFSELLYPGKSKPSTLLTPAAIWLVILLSFYLPIQAYTTAPEGFSRIEEVLAMLLLCVAIAGVVMWCITKLFEITGVGCLCWLYPCLCVLIDDHLCLLATIKCRNDSGFYHHQYGSFISLSECVGGYSSCCGLQLGLYLAIRSGKVAWVKMIIVLCIVGAMVNSIVMLKASEAAWSRETKMKNRLNCLNTMTDFSVSVKRAITLLL